MEILQLPSNKIRRFETALRFLAPIFFYPLGAVFIKEASYEDITKKL